MNTHRFAALALVTCAASLSVTACTAGITTAVSTASPARASSAATGRTSSAAAASPRPASSGSTVAMGGSIGSFPVPPGAKIGETGGGEGEIVLIFGSVTPAKVSSFYATALPRAGYTISMNSVISQNGGTAAIVEFAGHGYKGNIDALSSYPSTGVTISGLGHKNVTTISFMPK
jgi:hypothetical protein